MPLVFDKSQAGEVRNSYKERLLFLGIIIDGSLIVCGIVLICTALARLIFNIDDSPLSIPQVIQGLLGLFLFIFGIYRKVTSYLIIYTGGNRNRVKKLIGLFPFVSLISFLIYRIQLEDIKAYRRLVEEGSLVEWLSFLFLLLSSLLFFLAAKNRAWQIGQ